MRRCLTLLATLAAILATVPVTAQTPAADRDAAAYLAGNWKMLFEGKGDCGFPANGNQIGFEFARSGGRALLYEGPDIWTGFVGMKATLTGDRIEVSALDWSGERHPVWSLKRRGPDEMEIIRADGEPGRILQRCPPVEQLRLAPDVGGRDLLPLTLDLSGLPMLGQLLPGEDPGKLCRGEQKPADADRPSYEHGRTTIGFQLFGPGRAWIFVFGQGPLADFSTVEAIRRTAPDTLVLSITHLPSAKHVELEVRIRADRVEIPAFGGAFFSCTPEQQAAMQKRQSGED